MAKRFAEHNGLNLTKVNDDILEMWREKNVFWRCVLLKILSTAIRR